MVAGHSGEHGLEHTAGNARSRPSLAPTYTTPFARAGEDSMGAPRAAEVQSGVHGSEQDVGNAYSRPSTPPTNTLPPATAGDEDTPFWMKWCQIHEHGF